MSVKEIKQEIIKLMEGKIKYKCQESIIPNLALVVISEEEYLKLFNYLCEYQRQSGIDLGIFMCDDGETNGLYDPGYWETENDDVSYGYSGISAISQKDRETIADMGYIEKLEEDEYRAGYDWIRFFKNKEAIIMNISFFYKI